MKNLVATDPKLLSEIIWTGCDDCIWSMKDIYYVFKSIFNKVIEVRDKEKILVLNVAPNNILVYKKNGDKIGVDFVSKEYCLTKDCQENEKPIPPNSCSFLAMECHLWSDNRLNEKTVVYNLSCLLFWMCKGISWYHLNFSSYKTPYFQEKMINNNDLGSSYYGDIISKIVYNGLMLCESKRWSFKQISNMLQLA